MTKARENSDYTGLQGDLAGLQTNITAGDTAARAGRKNLIINGSAMVSQRGSYTSATTIQNASYFLDRFRFQNSVVTGTVQHTSISLNGVNKKAIKVAATSTGTGYLILQQTVEFESIQVGENYTVSCWVRSNNANTRFRQNTFRATSEDGTAFTNDGNWEKVSWTFSSTGTTGSPTVNIAMYNNANVSISNGDYFEITELQLETGSVATDFEHRSYGEELALCQRYYEPFGNGWTGYDENGSSTVFFGRFKVAKRTDPTIAALTTNMRMYQWGISDRDASTVSFISVEIHENGGHIKCGGFPSVANGTIFGLGYNSSGTDGEPFSADAEL